MIDNKIFYEKKLSEIINIDDNELQEPYKNDILKLKEILNNNMDYIVLKVVEDNIETSINDDLVLKNIELKADDITYVINTIELKKFIIFYEILKNNNVRLFVELNKELENISYEEYKEFFKCFEKDILTQDYINLIKDFSIRNTTQFKVLKHLNLQLDKYKKYTLNTIKSLL